MIARYTSEGEFTHFEHKEDQQFSGIDRNNYKSDDDFDYDCEE